MFTKKIFTTEKVDLIETYLEKMDWQIKENANATYSLHGMRNYIYNEVSKDFQLTKIYSQEIANAHLQGDLHIHDLGELNAYCVGWDLQDLLRRGFGGVRGKIDCLPAKHFSSALGQLVNFFFTLQGETAGAQAVSNFDTLLAPFIRYDKLEINQVKQHIQEFIFNLNVPTRVGFQTPFTNLTMDLECPKHLQNENIIIGGKLKSEKYGDFQEEMNMLNQAFAEVMSQGDGLGRVFSFPIPTYNLTKGFDWENPNLQPIWEMTAKYGIPYFANFINSDMEPEDTRSMCCRLRLDNTQLKKRLGGLFGSSPLTGSLGVVTINLPRIGFLSENLEQALESLEELMKIAKDSLEVKRELVENLTENGMYPYAKVYLDSVKAQTGHYWHNHFSTIGLVGMNEFLINLLGQDLTTQKGQQVAEQILDFMQNLTTQFQTKTGHLFNLEATPAEGVSYRLAKKDKEVYQDILCANEIEYNLGHEPYYTNSSHLPVSFSEDIFSSLDLQNNLQTKYTGGTVFHGFLGERVHDLEAMKRLIRKISENFEIPYFTLTPTFSICPNHGYQIGEKHNCDKCNSECEVYSRVVGYLRPVDQWNGGKVSEFRKRKTYNNLKNYKTDPKVSKISLKIK